MKDIQKFVYGKGKGEFEDKSRFGSIYHTRGVVAGIVTTEAIRTAQARYGKGKPITGEQMRWGIENLNIDDKRLEGARRRRPDAAAQGLVPGPRRLAAW